MWLSWRPEHSLALVKSKDGIHWSKPPVIVFGPRKESNWESEEINRPGVLKQADGYHMWYTGQGQWLFLDRLCHQRRWITWKRMSDKPVLSPDKPWEEATAMCPHVIWDAVAKSYPCGIQEGASSMR